MHASGVKNLIYSKGNSEVQYCPNKSAPFGLDSPLQKPYLELRHLNHVNIVLLSGRKRYCGGSQLKSVNYALKGTTVRLTNRLCLTQSALEAYPTSEISSDSEQNVSNSIHSIFSSDRIKVVALVALAMALCNAVRVVMSVAIVPMSGLHKWTPSFTGIVQSSFLWGYLMSPIAAGALADKYGGKLVMGCGVALWSAATILTPWAASHSLGMLLMMRTLLGAAEGVAMPCMNNMISRWFPRSERGRAIAVAMAGFHLGSAGGLLITPLLLNAHGLSGPFFVFGLLGLTWLCPWLYAISKDPQSHRRIRQSELLYIQEGLTSQKEINAVYTDSKTPTMLPPFRLLLSKLPTWAIILANFVNNWGYFIMLSWMPVYFNSVHNVNLRQAAWFSAIPWVMMAAIGFLAGSCSDFLISRRVPITIVRKIMQSVGFLGPAISLLGLVVAHDARIAAAWLTAAVGLSAFSQAGFLVNHQEIGPRFAGVLHGMSNTAGTIAAIISTIGTGYFVQWLGSFDTFLIITSMLYLLSTLFWVVFASGERVFT